MPSSELLRTGSSLTSRFFTSGSYNGFSKKSYASTIDLIELKSCGILISFVGPFTEVE